MALKIKHMGSTLLIAHEFLRFSCTIVEIGWLTLAGSVSPGGVVLDGEDSGIVALPVTGGRGGLTWQAHCEFVESF